MQEHLATPLIYNLHPRLAGPMDQWNEHIDRAGRLGFNWVYINPVSYPGFSGSLYATKEHRRLNPAFVPPGAACDDLTLLAPVVARCKARGLHPMIDLVVNHTAIDCPLVAEHPAWYVWEEDGQVRRPSAVDVDDPTKKTVWGDLAEIDNRYSADRAALWEFWGELVDTYLELGFEGFRCDAAYKVPVDLWRFLIERARRTHRDAVFWAENLGCTLEESRELCAAGLQWFCNSSKWWNYRDAWCLEQRAEFAGLPSISFPETHDTERLASESGGREAVQRQRLAFAAVFSTGLMIPMGYEVGARRKLDVVTTMPEDWDTSEWNLGDYVPALLACKRSYPAFQGEGHVQAVEVESPYLVVLRRESGSAADQTAWIVINTHESQTQTVTVDRWLDRQGDLDVLRLSSLDLEPGVRPCHGSIDVNPDEIVAILPRP